MKRRSRTSKALWEIYELMLGHFGPRRWWPAETNFEIVVGAILTQSVAWRNVAKAIENLRNADLLSLEAMHAAKIEEIEPHIVPTLYWRMKAKKLKTFVNHVMEQYNGNLEMLLAKDKADLREELLELYGIGQETADSIILYAARKPIFVVDAYTKRIFSRLGFCDEKISYAEMQSFFSKHLEPEVQIYNEYHALIVGIGNRYCANKKPACDKCPLSEQCKYCTS